MTPNFSFYELTLRSFLNQNHPALCKNNEFIEARSNAAATAYANAFEAGNDSQQCRKIANDTLFEGLNFSNYNLLLAVLREQFSIVDEMKLKTLALNLQIELNHIFAQYDLTDDFEAHPEYQTLYTELTGAIQEKSEGNGL